MFDNRVIIRVLFSSQYATRKFPERREAGGSTIDSTYKSGGGRSRGILGGSQR